MGSMSKGKAHGTRKSRRRSSRASDSTHAASLSKRRVPETPVSVGERIGELQAEADLHRERVRTIERKVLAALALSDEGAAAIVAFARALGARRAEKTVAPVPELQARFIQAGLDLLPSELGDLRAHDRAALEVITFVARALSPDVGAEHWERLKRLGVAACGTDRGPGKQSRNRKMLGIIARFPLAEDSGDASAAAKATLRAVALATHDERFENVPIERAVAALKEWAPATVAADLLLAAGIESQQPLESEAEARDRIARNIKKSR